MDKVNQQEVKHLKDNDRVNDSRHGRQSKQAYTMDKVWDYVVDKDDYGR